MKQRDMKPGSKRSTTLEQASSFRTAQRILRYSVVLIILAPILYFFFNLDESESFWVYMLKILGILIAADVLEALFRKVFGKTKAD